MQSNRSGEKAYTRVSELLVTISAHLTSLKSAVKNSSSTDTERKEPSSPASASSDKIKVLEACVGYLQGKITETVLRTTMRESPNYADAFFLRGSTTAGLVEKTLAVPRAVIQQSITALNQRGAHLDDQGYMIPNTRDGAGEATGPERKPERKS